MELPPRTRRIPTKKAEKTSFTGTTSAYAENTQDGQGVVPGQGNYLRVRGEYSSSSPKSLYVWELPPRTRRILAGEAQRRTNQGTTSAYAENTQYRP